MSEVSHSKDFAHSRNFGHFETKQMLSSSAPVAFKLEAGAGFNENEGLKQSTPQNRLPDTVQAKMENAFQADFSNVQVHTNSQAATQMKAVAFAQGENVHFAPGQFQPDNQSGQQLIGLGEAVLGGQIGVN